MKERVAGGFVGAMIVAFCVWFAYMLVDATHRGVAHNTAHAICEAVKLQNPNVAIVKGQCFALEDGVWVDQSAKFEVRP